MVLFRNVAAALALTISASATVNACSPTHDIVSGDTLWGIASEQMGSGWHYPQIFEQNRDIISNPNRIYVGDRLDIPCKTGVLGEIDWSIMPTPDAFEMIRQSVTVQIVDIRPADEVAAGTIPGALWMPYDRWRGPEDNPGAPRADTHFEAIIGQAGLRMDVPTLIVHSEGTPLSTGAGAYVYWVLKSLGGEELAILRGGFEAWKASGGKVAAKPAKPRPYNVDLAFSTEWRATAQEVMGVVVGKEPGILLDARPHHMFNQVNSVGEVIATTIPGARSLPAPPIMTALAGEFDIADGVETVIEHYRSKDALNHDDIITFCKSGQLSALNWFYASELASIDNVRLYPESLIGWKQTYGVLGVGEG